MKEENKWPTSIWHIYQLFIPDVFKCWGIWWVPAQVENLTELEGQNKHLLFVCCIMQFRIKFKDRGWNVFFFGVAQAKKCWGRCVDTNKSSVKDACNVFNSTSGRISPQLWGGLGTWNIRWAIFKASNGEAAAWHSDACHEEGGVFELIGSEVYWSRKLVLGVTRAGDGVVQGGYDEILSVLQEVLPNCQKSNCLGILWWKDPLEEILNPPNISSVEEAEFEASPIFLTEVSEEVKKLFGSKTPQDSGGSGDW